MGLVAGAGFADMGQDVVCCDIDAEKIGMLNRGQLPIFEPGLEKLVNHNVTEQRLSFTTDVPAAVAGAEVVVLAVGTPPGPDGSADLSFIFKAAESAARALTGWAVLVLAPFSVLLSAGASIIHMIAAMPRRPGANEPVRSASSPMKTGPSVPPTSPTEKKIRRRCPCAEGRRWAFPSGCRA